MLCVATGAAFPIARSVQKAGGKFIVRPEEIEPSRFDVALVLGAPARDGAMTPVLADRVHTAIELYRDGRVKRLLLSGTKSEVDVMSEAARSAGVDAEALLHDPAGRHTFESFENARASGHGKLVVVTQRFHLPRSLFIAERMGIEALGVVADKRRYLGIVEYRARELFSSVLAYWMTR